MKNYKDLIIHLRQLDTEQVNPDTVDLDCLSAIEIVRKINNEDRKVAEIVAGAIPEIARAAEIFAATLRRGGRVFYIGAGTSGRLGVLDAAECPPTFGTAPAQIVGLISGGHETLVLSREGAEDNRSAAVEDLKQARANRDDFVIGLAASKRTPYTTAGLEHARQLGCRTAFIICNPRTDLKIEVDILIELPVGPEVITGSTRMKSATAQKMTLNMISTTAMVLLGKTFGNLMIDLQARSEKLAARSRKILMELLGVSLEDAEKLLRLADGSVKLAIVIHQFKCTKEEARDKLERSGGFVRRIKA
ncbi:MAG: N-acetylmuramic acid 6-phosphate etherase [candidate division Zixibacteria bacterium]|nr:N-acetylmuramic acid 6-phosphate etherase [candidate division Zixibacteria bacterium]